MTTIEELTQLALDTPYCSRRYTLFCKAISELEALQKENAELKLDKTWLQSELLRIKTAWIPQHRA